MYDNTKNHLIKNSKLRSLHNNVSLIFDCFHDEQYAQWHEKASKSTEKENCQTAKMFLSFIALLLLFYVPCFPVFVFLFYRYIVNVF